MTSLFVLAALDLRRSAGGEFLSAPADEKIFVQVLFRTFSIATAVTILCLVLGYPLAYVLASLPTRTANMLLVLVLLPFWTSLLVRTSAWIVLLQHEGVINSALLQAGMIEAPFELLYRRAAVYAAMTHVLLPFMVLPLYAAMRTIPVAHVRAALSLGATPITAFWRVYAPQTLPAVGAGVLMVFIQALGYYITPALVGGPDDQILSYFIAFYASKTINWGMAAALSLALLAATIAMCWVYDRLSASTAFAWHEFAATCLRDDGPAARAIRLVVLRRRGAGFRLRRSGSSCRFVLGRLVLHFRCRDFHCAGTRISSCPTFGCPR